MNHEIYLFRKRKRAGEREWKEAAGALRCVCERDSKRNESDKLDVSDLTLFAPSARAYKLSARF